MKSPPFRIGAVSYLNTKPLIHGLSAGQAEFPLDDWRLELDLPSRLADRLDTGTLDVALIPSLSFWQRPDYRIISQACIACRGPVLSVKLLARCPMADVKSLALDEGSRTSAALAQILLKEKLNIEPPIEPFPIGQRLEDTSADAILIIGDRAMHVDENTYEEVWDLGEAWCRWFSLPFVFAMWVARPGVDTSDLEPLLNQARDAGMAEVHQIAEREAARLNWPTERCLQYFQEHLHFGMGPEEWSGLCLFYQHAVRWGYAPSGWDSERAEVFAS